jgi:hypothetical protein
MAFIVSRCGLSFVGAHNDIKRHSDVITRTGSRSFETNVELMKLTFCDKSISKLKPDTQRIKIHLNKDNECHRQKEHERNHKHLRNIPHAKHL